MVYNFSAVARATELAEAVTGSATLLKVSSVSGLPPAPFTVVVDVATESEEILTVTGLAGLNLTVERGQDGTAAVPHQVGAVVRHAVTARDFRRFEAHGDASSNVHGVGSGSDVVGTATTQTLTNKTLDGGQNTFTALPGSALNNGSVTNAKLGTGAVDTVKISDLAVSTAKLADGAVTTVKLGDGQVTSAKIADGTIATADLANGAVTDAKVASGVDGAKLSGTITTARIPFSQVGLPGDVKTGRVERASGADENVTGTSQVILVSGSAGTLVAGTYRIEGEAMLYGATQAIPGYVFLTAGGNTVEFRHDVQTGVLQPARPWMILQHGGGTMNIGIGYRRISDPGGSALLKCAGTSGGLTYVQAELIR